MAQDLAALDGQQRLACGWERIGDEQVGDLTRLIGFFIGGQT